MSRLFGAVLRGGAGDRGALAPAVPIIAMMLFLLGGLVVDSARQLNARSRAVAYAEEAARAGAQRIDLNAELAVVDVATAGAAVQRYCATVRAQDPVVVECAATAVEPGRVTVRVRTSIPAVALSVIGVGPLQSTGEAEAIPQQGVTGVDQYPDVPPPSVAVSDAPIPFEVGPPAGDPTVTPAPPPPSPDPSASPEPTGSPGPSGSPEPTGSPNPDPDPSPEPSPDPSGPVPTPSSS